MIHPSLKNLLIILLLTVSFILYTQTLISISHLVFLGITSSYLYERKNNDMLSYRWKVVVYILLMIVSILFQKGIIV